MDPFNTTNMKLLFITQKVDRNDDVLGFAHEWMRLLGREFGALRVVCLQQGPHDLDEEHIQIYSLGKERGGSRMKYLLRLLRYVHTYRHEYDAVLVHMNPEYIVVAGWLWKLYGKPISLWYAHGKVNMKLRIAAWFADLILTSTPNGFRLAHSNVQVIGQGIDTSLFSPGTTPVGDSVAQSFRFMYVGRISPVKNVALLIDAVHVLIEEGRNCTLDIIGSAVTPTDTQYERRIQQQIVAHALSHAVHMTGSVPNRLLPSKLRTAQCFINAGATGSLDKTMVEAMATGLPVVTSNRSFGEIAGTLAEPYMFREGELSECASAMRRVMDMQIPERMKLGTALRDIVVRDHSIERFVRNIRTHIENIPIT